MFLDSKRKILAEPHTHLFESDKFAIYWEGLVFIKGILSGADSISVFSEQLSEKGIVKACSALSGNFCIIVHDRSDNIQYAFVDNDGSSRIFYDELFLSSSFLALAEQKNLSFSDLDPFSVIEFVHSGKIFGSRPFFKDINILSPGKIIARTGQSMQLISKEFKRIVPALSHEDTFLDTFSKLAASLRNRKLKLHLTGGGDTRLLALLFGKENRDLDTFTVGTPGLKDVEISKKLAEIMKLNNQTFYHPVSDENSTLRDLQEIFEFSDGLFDTLSLYQGYHSHQRTKHSDTDLVISGKGGELYKYAEWWPLTKEKRENTVERLVTSGYVNWYSAPCVPSEIFSDSFKHYASDYMPDLARKLNAQFLQYSGKELCDRIFYDYSIRGDYRLPKDNNVLRVYSPLLDRELAACARRIPAFDRVFTKFHQRIINSLDPAASRLEITDPRYGYAKGINWLFGQMTTKIENRFAGFRRLIRFSRNNRRRDEPDDWSAVIYDAKTTAMNCSHSIYDVVKHSGKGRDNIEYLKKIGILKPDIHPEEIDNLFFGRLFSLAQLLNRLKI